jgi:predicted dienelactone hydrolase
VFSRFFEANFSDTFTFHKSINQNPMPNPLITLSNSATVVNDFNQLLAPRNQALFVVLGNTPALRDFANQAANLSVNWRRAVLITVADAIYPTLQGLPSNGGGLPAAYDPASVMALSLSFNGTVCDILDNTEADPGDINAAYMLAETFKPA